jgi:hypothetical protein
MNYSSELNTVGVPQMDNWFIASYLTLFAIVIMLVIQVFFLINWITKLEKRIKHLEEK